MTSSPLRFFSRLLRLPLTALAMLAAAGLPACGEGSDTTSEPGYESPAPSPSPTPLPPPAAPPRVPVDLPDHATEIVEYGSGPTTVVFESGLGSDWSPWKKVATEVSARARTFAYSRPGYGDSAPSSLPRDASHIVESLRALLVSHGLQPPYVLVGHSFGGGYMELFAKAHPDEVLGLVLVEPRHRDFTAACVQAGFEGCAIDPDVVASLPQVQIDEVNAYQQISGEIAAAGGFGAYPVRVLTATAHGFSPEVEALWESQHGALADEASDGEQTIFEGFGHVLQIQRPHEVAEVILSLVPAPEG